MLVRDALRLGTIDSLDRELLLTSVLKKDRAFVLAHPEYKLRQAQVKRFEKLVERREQNEPLAYIIGEKEFFGLSFLVNQFTLIPRPETEFLVEHALNRIKNRKLGIENEKKRMAIVDVGTGSGCIIISVVKNLLTTDPTLPTPQFFAVDISSKAIAVAKENARRHGVEENIAFVQSDLLKQIQNNLQTFDELIILANLPYLSEKLYQATDPTVQNFEPRKALVSGTDGLDHYRELLAELKVLSHTKKIAFLLEISPEQATPLKQILTDSGAKLQAVLLDLSGRERVIHGSF